MVVIGRLVAIGRGVIEWEHCTRIDMVSLTLNLINYQNFKWNVKIQISTITSNENKHIQTLHFNMHI